MKTPKEKLATILSEQGWRLEEIQDDNLEWWVDEIWEMRSIWSPEGIPAYISFLVDPQHEGSRAKGQSVWGAGCTGQYPASVEEAQSNGNVSLIEISKNKAGEFMQNIESLRSGAVNDIGL